MKEDILLEVRGLKTYFKSEDKIVKAVDDVSFKVRKGETVGIVGESGSGKSITCLSTMGLIPQPNGYIAGGEILYRDNTNKLVDICQLSQEDMRHYQGNEISMIFQEPMSSLNPVFTCGEQVLENILLHKDIDRKTAIEEVIQLFEKVQLPNPHRIYKAYPHQISGGQKQRVMIAMALSCKPKILIADEPTTALDVTVQKTILELMASLRKEIEASVVFITHDLGVIAEIADWVVVMYKGKVVEQGTVRDIFLRPQHPYTKSLLACRPPLEQRLSQLPVVHDFMQVEFDDQGNRIIREKSTSIELLKEEYLISTEQQEQRLKTLMQNPPILEVKNLKTYFPKQRNWLGKVKSWVKAVDDVSFVVYPGETLGLVGESGCGKTTLGRSILRLVEAASGEVLFEGKDLLKLPPRQLRTIRKDVQIIFQDPYSSLNPRMTIGNAIMEPMQVHKLHKDNTARKAKVIELLETVGLEAKHFDRYPHQFSGGQRQRICIARTLALEPRFIICDESVSALDVSVQAQVLNLLIKLRNQHNFTYIFISHDLSVVKFMSDRMLVMNQGKIEELNTADEIYNNPQSDYTKELIAAIPKGEI